MNKEGWKAKMKESKKINVMKMNNKGGRRRNNKAGRRVREGGRINE